MIFYLFKRLILLIPTLFIIFTINFFIIQMAPGGPVEQLINKINHQTISGEVAMSSSLNKSISINPINNTAISSNNQATEIEPELLAEINKTFGFNLSLALAIS